MAEEIDESGFYREDFSTESDWEVFNAQLGEIFEKWNLSNSDWGRPLVRNELHKCKWQVQVEKIELLGKQITVCYYAAELIDLRSELVQPSNSSDSQVHVDLMSMENTFVASAMSPQNSDLHTLARLYGLRRFVVMYPTKPTHFLSNPSEFTFFRSACNVVAAEVCSTVPIFVQIYDPKWNFFVGVHVEPSLRINFDLVAMESAPREYKYLSGLLSLFKEKLPVSYKRPAVCSVRRTNFLDLLRVRIPLHMPFDDKTPPFVSDDPLLSVPFTALPYGYFPDSCTEIYMVYTWHEIAENMAIDTELRTEFDPNNESLRYEQSEVLAVHANGYLSSCLSDFFKLATATQTLESYVGRNYSGIASATETANPLDQLTQHKLPQLRHRSSVQDGSTKSTQKKLPGPMDEAKMNELLSYLFPNMKQGERKFAYVKHGAAEEFDPLRIKSAPYDSIVTRLACLLATCNAHLGKQSGVAQLWATFTRELRYHVDNCIKIPSVAPGFPDTRTCLLHQKLQMLNICMERRALRESGRFNTSRSPSDDDDDEYEEFYDCDTEEVTPAAAESVESDDKEPSPSSSPSYEQPEGRLRRLRDLKLLGNGKPLYVPITQDPVPKTEDQLHDDAEVMLKLGPGSGLTTQMMCCSLLSDMEAFKAANPQAAMEDFIRWYSPKDWEESTDADGNTVGQLSARMLAPDNTWQTVWKQAHPVPASRQKRLFDDTNEALKVLHYLETRSIGEIYELTLVPLLHAAVLFLNHIVVKMSAKDLFNQQIHDILADICRLSRDIEIIGQTEIGSISTSPDPEPILQKIALFEQNFYQYNCYKRMFGTLYEDNLSGLQQKFRETLENGGSCNLPVGQLSDGNVTEENSRGGEWGFGGEGGLFYVRQDNLSETKVASKEYVIRVDGETTTLSKGQAGPQFLRAVITGDKLRLCGAFSENTTFI